MGELLESSGNAPRSAEDAEHMTVFGDVRFNTHTGELHVHDRIARLTPKAAAVLTALLEGAPDLVTKEQLLNRVWSGRAISDEALTSCILELRRALDDDARNPRYIETRHRRGYRLLATLPTAYVPPASGAAPVPYKPSLAVLPFDSLSSDPDQEYFADGVVEDMTTALSRVGSFFVVARNSSFIFKGKKVQAQEVGRQLGVRYIVEGSMQRAGKRLRMTAQLIEADTGHHLWADRYDGELSDVFDLQDWLVASVVGAISPSVQEAEIKRALLKRPESLQAYDYVLRAYPRWRSLEDPEHEEAMRLFHKALELEPSYAHAMAMAAWAHGQRFGRVMRGDLEENRRQAIELANAALALDPDDPGVLLAAANALLHGAIPEDIDRCELIIGRALAIDPNSALGWVRKGFLHVARSEPAEAIVAFERSIRLSPLDPAQAYARFGIGDAHFIAGRLDESLKFHRHCLAEKPRDPASKRRVCALLALVGEVEEAQRMAQSLLADHPHFTLERIAQAKPFQSPYVEMYLEGLRRAGFSVASV
jgi:adenylate cyclase